jgi:hypothetical protein
MNEKRRWLIVVVFASTMAWVESAVVLYMRMLLERSEIYRQGPLPASLGLGQTELIREGATLIMLFAVGWLAGKSWRDRLGYTLIAFGVWDILYYLFLIPLTGWPKSLLDWDLLFLIPLPWWGPVLAPLTIAGVMILTGFQIIGRERRNEAAWPGRIVWGLHALGILVALYVFMSASIHAVWAGSSVHYYRPPAQFDWPLFILSLGLMAVPTIAMLRQPGLLTGKRRINHESPPGVEVR